MFCFWYLLFKFYKLILLVLVCIYVCDGLFGDSVVNVVNVVSEFSYYERVGLVGWFGL